MTTTNRLNYIGEFSDPKAKLGSMYEQYTIEELIAQETPLLIACSEGHHVLMDPTNQMSLLFIRVDGEGFVGEESYFELKKVDRLYTLSEALEIDFLSHLLGAVEKDEMMDKYALPDLSGEDSPYKSLFFNEYNTPIGPIKVLNQHEEKLDIDSIFYELGFLEE